MNHISIGQYWISFVKKLYADMRQHRKILTFFFWNKQHCHLLKILQCTHPIYCVDFVYITFEIRKTSISLYKNILLRNSMAKLWKINVVSIFCVYLSGFTFLFLNYCSYCVQKHKIFPMTALYNTYKFKTDTSLRKYDLHFW
jgi:hypothetical protein